MRERWKVGVGLLALALLILVCSSLLQLMPRSATSWSGYLELSRGKFLFWIEGERAQPGEDVDLVLQVNDFFWTVDQVLYFNITDLQNTGRRKQDTVVVDLTAINRSNRRIPLAFCYVEDEKGQKFEAIPSNAIPFEESLFGGVTIEPGERVRGKLAFAVPKGHLPLWLRCAEYNVATKIEEP